MRILVVHNRYGAYSGEERTVDNLCRLLSVSGEEVARFERTSAGAVDSFTGRVRAFFAGLGANRAISEFSDLLYREHWDIVHVHNLYPFISPAILPHCRRRGVPVVMTVHNYRLACPNGLFFAKGKICEMCRGGREYWCAIKNCERDLPKSTAYALRSTIARVRRQYVDNVDVFHCLTHFQKNILRREGYPEDRLVVQPPSTPAAPAVSFPKSEGWVGFLGRVSAEKGIGIFTDAARLLPTVQFVVVGNPGKGPSLAASAPSNLTYLGPMGHGELEAFFQQCLPLVIPSVCYEGFPTVALEAIARGIPIVASDIGGMSELLQDGHTALLFAAGRGDELAERIHRIRSDRELSENLGRNARKKFLGELSESNFLKGMMDIYAKAHLTRGKVFAGN